jgi:hypothetical protein
MKSRINILRVYEPVFLFSAVSISANKKAERDLISLSVPFFQDSGAACTYSSMQEMQKAAIDNNSDSRTHTYVHKCV